MKVILTGATGYIGSSVLQHLVASSEVDSVVVLSRRDLPASPSSADPKVKVLIVKDFLNYTPEVLEEIGDAEACVWTLGGPTSDKSVHHDFPRAFADALLKVLNAASARGKQPRSPFRFISCSGFLSVRDQNASVWVLGAMRKMRGTVESDMLSLGASNKSAWQTFVVRPAWVLSGIISPIASRILPLWIARPYTIDIDVIGNAFAKLAIYGDERQTLENADLVELGNPTKRKS